MYDAENRSVDFKLFATKTTAKIVDLVKSLNVWLALAFFHACHIGCAHRMIDCNDHFVLASVLFVHFTQASTATDL